MNLAFLIIFLSVSLIIMIVLGIIEILRVLEGKIRLKDICCTLEITHTNATNPIVYVRARSREDIRILMGSGRIKESCVDECVDRPICRTISLDLRKVLYILGRAHRDHE